MRLHKLEKVGLWLIAAAVVAILWPLLDLQILERISTNIKVALVLAGVGATCLFVGQARRHR